MDENTLLVYFDPGESPSDKDVAELNSNIEQVG